MASQSDFLNDHGSHSAQSQTSSSVSVETISATAKQQQDDAMGMIAQAPSPKPSDALSAEESEALRAFKTLSERRAEQNRAAQKTFRLRKKMYVKDLEEKLVEYKMLIQRHREQSQQLSRAHATLAHYEKERILWEEDRRRWEMDRSALIAKCEQMALEMDGHARFDKTAPPPSLRKHSMEETYAGRDWHRPGPPLHDNMHLPPPIPRFNSLSQALPSPHSAVSAKRPHFPRRPQDGFPTSPLIPSPVPGGHTWEHSNNAHPLHP